MFTLSWVSILRTLCYKHISMIWRTLCYNLHFYNYALFHAFGLLFEYKLTFNLYNIICVVFEWWEIWGFSKLYIVLRKVCILRNVIPALSSHKFRKNGNECVMKCGNPCNVTDTISQVRWESLKSKSEKWSGLDKFGDVYSSTSWDTGPSGNYMHNSCYITISQKRNNVKRGKVKN